MHIHIETEDAAGRERIIQLLAFALNGHREVIASLHFSVTSIRDRLSTPLRRCRLRAELHNGRPLEIEEVQSDLDLGVTRALERLVRTIDRQQGLQHRHDCT